MNSLTVDKPSSLDAAFRLSSRDKQGYKRSSVIESFSRERWGKVNPDSTDVMSQNKDYSSRGIQHRRIGGAYG